MNPAIPLRRQVHELYVQSRLNAARLIQNAPGGPERMAEAERLLRETMIETATGSLSKLEKAEIFAILAFALPPVDTSKIPKMSPAE